MQREDSPSQVTRLDLLLARDAGQAIAQRESSPSQVTRLDLLLARDAGQAIAQVNLGPLLRVLGPCIHAERDLVSRHRVEQALVVCPGLADEHAQGKAQGIVQVGPRRGVALDRPAALAAWYTHTARSSTPGSAASLPISYHVSPSSQYARTQSMGEAARFGPRFGGDRAWVTEHG